MAFVTAEVVEHHNVTGLKGWDENLLGISLEVFAVDGSVKHLRCDDPLMTQCCQERYSLPWPEWDLGSELLTPQRPAAQRLHVRLAQV